MLPHFAAHKSSSRAATPPSSASVASLAAAATGTATVQLMSINMKLFWKGNVRAVARDEEIEDEQEEKEEKEGKADKDDIDTE